MLIADDNKLVRLKLARLLETTANMDLLVAENGLEALAMFEANPEIQVGILDWEMPGMDGVEVCRRIRKMERRHYTYIMMLTARSERSDLYEGLRAGADDYITKPFDPIELQLKLQIALRITNLERILEDQNRELESAYTIVAEGLQAAGRVQQQLLPDERLMAEIARRHRSFIKCAYEPCQTLGGDVVLVTETNAGDLAFCVADVSGHGIAAAMSAALLHACVRTSIEIDPDPRNVICRANRYCCDELPSEVYATMVYGLLDPANGKLKMVVAGHPPPLIARADGSLEDLEACMPPLGLFEDAADDFSCSGLELRPGDQLVLYTDGAIEARNGQGEFFDLKHLRAEFSALVSMKNGYIPQALLQSVREWRGLRVPLEDDVSVLCLSYRPALSSVEQLVAVARSLR